MLKAGFARLDITPPLGTPLDGYQRVRQARYILDPIEVNAIALNDGEKTVIMIAADLEGLSVADGKHIKGMMLERLGLPEESILLCALHQHTSLMLNNQDKSGRLPAAYIEILYTKFCDAAQLAIDDMSEAALSTAEKETAEPLAFVRRYRLDDGRAITNPAPKDIPHIVSRLAEADNTVRVLRFERQGKKDIAILNFSTHPDVVHGENVSADWPGFARRFVERDIPDVSCLLFVGAEGDSNHIDFIKGKKDGYDHSRHMGRLIADAVIEVWNKTTPRKCDGLFANISVIYNKSNTEGEEKYDECKAFMKARAEGTLGYDPNIEEVAYARRIIEIRESMLIYRPIPVTVIGIGEVAIVGFGGEAFTEYGAAARKAADGKFTLTFCLANGHQGYLPSKEAFDQGGYEARGSRFTPTVQEEVINAAKKMLDQF